MENSFDWVFLDLETTGLDAEKDRIIEIAAVSISRNGERQEFQQLINPGIPIPAYITGLTGIDDKMVKEAPSFEDAAPFFNEFLRGKMIVAHNASFDLGFLQRQYRDNPLRNSFIDTIELAKLAFPSAYSYSLRNLADNLLDGKSGCHRALPDTLALERLFFLLLKKLQGLPLPTLQIAASLLEHPEKGLPLLMRKLLDEKIKNYNFMRGPLEGSAKQQEMEDYDAALSDDESVYRTISQDDTIFWDIAAIEKLFQAGSPLADRLKPFQPRPQQIVMAKNVAKALQNGRHLLAEAGTGVGKSLAYLVPAVIWAVTQQERVVISTHTIALQEQLIEKEIALLQNMWGKAFQAAVLKGRSNYLCLKKYYAAKENAAVMAWPERFFLARLACWFEHKKTGDRDSINLNEWEQEYYSLLSSASETCQGTECTFHRECYYQKARKKAYDADVVVVNHSLLLADLKLGEKVLPSYDYVIVDEAHHLEEEGARQFSEVFSLKELCRKINMLQRKRGIFSKTGILSFWEQYLANCGRLAGSDIKNTLQEEIETVQMALSEINQAIKELTESIPADIINHTFRIKSKDDEVSGWREKTVLLDNLCVRTAGLLDALSSLKSYLAECGEIIAGNTDVAQELKQLYDQLKTDYEVLRAFVSFEQAEDKVYWVETDTARKDLRLYITPLDTVKYFREMFFDTKASVVLTSATLSIQGSFNFLMEQLGMDKERVDTSTLLSPFLYNEQALFLVDTGLPDPAVTSEEGYSLAVADALLRILEATGGNTLILFTSYRQMRSVFELINEPLRQKGLELYADGINGRRNVLLRELQNNPQSVVCGAGTFWEGIDLPGTSLKTIIIVKLPFSPPTAPLVEAKLERLYSEGKNGFRHYSLPQAVIKFRQGVGRLIRTMEDYGIVVVLDNRLVQKQYGRTFLDSLPGLSCECGKTDDLTARIRQWFAKMEGRA